MKQNKISDNKKQKNYILLSILVIMIIIVYLIALIKIAG
ncbi:putative membrane protein [Rickettsia felis str. Pedreira]|uniref:Putative membrane protein n=1 Tax=Rickettsia felis str. Pedreira TaxID=1359196 RepID=A0A0F3MQ97_RICFI|nr:putative membrane protein [Rickettsia felis str. Pedreira]